MNEHRCNYLKDIGKGVLQCRKCGKKFYTNTLSLTDYLNGEFKNVEREAQIDSFKNLKGA